MHRFADARSYIFPHPCVFSSWESSPALCLGRVYIASASRRRASGDRFVVLDLCCFGIHVWATVEISDILARVVLFFGGVLGGGFLNIFKFLIKSPGLVKSRTNCISNNANHEVSELERS